MQLANDQPNVTDGEDRVALDWAALGRRVRREALTAVALHFAEMGERDLQDALSTGECAQARAQGPNERMVHAL